MSRRPRPVMTPTSGVCRYCRCTEAHACLIENPAGPAMSCAWADMERTVCTNFNCMKRYLQESLGPLCTPEFAARVTAKYRIAANLDVANPGKRGRA